MKGMSKRKLAVAVLVTMVIVALWAGAGFATDIVGDLNIPSAPASTFTGAVVYLSTAGQSAPMSQTQVYTIDPYANPGDPGYYEFLSLNPGSYVITPMCRVISLLSPRRTSR